MAKKKENPPVEEKKTGEAEKAANTAAENEIPDSGSGDPERKGTAQKNH